MKVLVPHKHNEMLLESVRCGQTFWYKEVLYMKTYIIKSNQITDNNIPCVNLSEGHIIYISDSELVILDDNICVTELQSEERMNREINIECRARELSEKLRLINNNEQYKSIFIQYQNRGGKYIGPSYADELERLEEALES